MDQDRSDPPTRALPPHRVSSRNTGARAVLVILAVVAVTAGLWWLAQVL